MQKVLLIFLLFPLAIFSQEISGKIVSAGDNQPIPFANLVWLNNEVGLVADFEGNFNLNEIFPADTLQISAVGFKDVKITGTQLKTNSTILLTPTAEVLTDVKIEVKRRKRRKRKTDPSYILHQKIAQNRKTNDLKLNKNYTCNVYNKVEIDLNNVDSTTKNDLLFKPIGFIFNSPDTTSLNKPYVPVFIGEGFSLYKHGMPNKISETIIAAKNAGVNIPSIAQYTGNAYTNFNIYDNYIRVIQKQFISPIAPASWLSYKYYLTDSFTAHDTTFYKLEFLPRRAQDLAFSGYLITNNKDYGINEIELSVPKAANINFVEEFVVKQTFSYKDALLALRREKILIDLNPLEKSYGFYIQKNTEWINYDLVSAVDTNDFDLNNIATVEDSAYEKGSERLDKLRPIPLTQSDSSIYFKVDSAANTKYLKRIQAVSQMLVTGYYPFKKWEFGPYYTLYSFNSIEGRRYRAGFVTTPQLYKNLRLKGHLAYGTTDERFKFQIEATKYYGFKKWRYFKFEHLDDYKIISASDNAFTEDNILASLTRRIDPPFTHTIKSRFTWFHEWQPGVSNYLTLKNIKYIPIGILDYKTANNESIDNLKVHSVTIGGRLAINETFVRAGFRRLSLLTTKPRFDYSFTLGTEINGEGYDFQEFKIKMTDRYFFGFFGFLDLKLEASKIWGDLPYPLLLNHQGNDSYYFDDQAFNMMNPFEFVSDQQVSVMAKYNFDGLIMNRVPLLRKLKLRSFVFANSVYGTLSSTHNDLVLLPESLSPLNEPYLETGFGIENIFKLIRLDFIWRLTNRNSPQAQPFGITFDIVPSF